METINKYIRTRVLSIHTEGFPVPKTMEWVFNRRNINTIAKNYDAKVEMFDMETKDAILRDSFGRLIMVESSVRRICKTCRRPV